jgi:transcriptional regulator with XRE-family HTH domain
MNHAVNADALEREMMLRGWTGADLARESRLSAATVSAALAGRPIAVSSVLLIAQALMRCPMVAMVDFLLPENPPQRHRPSSPTIHPGRSAEGGLGA